MYNWQMVLLEPAKDVLGQVSHFLVNILLVVIILLIGWLISAALRTAITKVLKTLKVDELSTKIELTSLLAKGGLAYTLSELVGVIIYWLALLVTVVVAINAVGLTIAADLLNRVVLYVPNIIAAIFILILGMFVSTFLKNVVQTAATNAGLAQSKLLAKAVELVVLVFALLITLEQLNIGARVIELTIAIFLASLGLGFALAFGLGCKDLVGKWVADFVEKLKK